MAGRLRAEAAGEAAEEEPAIGDAGSPLECAGLMARALRCLTCSEEAMPQVTAPTHPRRAGGRRAVVQAAPPAIECNVPVRTASRHIDCVEPREERARRCRRRGARVGTVFHCYSA